MIAVEPQVFGRDLPVVFCPEVDLESEIQDRSAVKVLTPLTCVFLGVSSES